MINLIPPAVKKQFLFARRNTFLVRYAVGAGIGFLIVVAVIVAGYLFLRQEISSYNDSIATAEAELAADKEKETIARVNEISSSLKLVVNVLGEEVLFSELLRQVGAAMPSGTVLQNLSLSSELSGAIDLQAGAVDYTSASQVQLNLQDPENRIFDTADLVSISCDDGADDSQYPCTVVLRAQFTKDNGFMLLSKQREATNE